MSRMNRARPDGEQLIGALIPAVRPRPAPPPAPLPALPTRRVSESRTLLVDAARVDPTGRVWASTLLRALAWAAGDRIDVDHRGTALTVRPALTGAHTVGARGIQPQRLRPLGSRGSSRGCAGWPGPASGRGRIHHADAGPDPAFAGDVGEDHAKLAISRSAPYGAAVPQSDINQLPVSHARARRNVVRLKGGDPFLCGRGKELIDARLHAGVPIDVVRAS